MRGLDNELPVSEGIYCTEESDQDLLPRKGRLRRNGLEFERRARGSVSGGTSCLSGVRDLG